MVRRQDGVLGVYELCLFLFSLTPVAMLLVNNCCCTCFTSRDDFTRANSTNLGADWTETSGDWSILSNNATVAAANAVLTYVPTLPGSAAGNVNTQITAHPGDASRVISRLYGASGNVYGEMDDDGTAFTTTFRLFVSGSEVQSIVFGGPSGGASLSLCWTSTKATLVYGTDSLGANAELTWESSASGNAGAIGTGSESTQTTFTFFEITDHQENTSYCEPCINCIDACGDGLPATVEITFANIANGACTCSGLNSVPFVLDRVVDLPITIEAGPGLFGFIYPACLYHYHDTFCSLDFDIYAWIAGGPSGYAVKVRIVFNNNHTNSINLVSSGQTNGTTCSGHTWTVSGTGGTGGDPCQSGGGGTTANVVG